MTLDDLLNGLNENQRRAVESTEGRVRVAAGAGSGKTRVLTLRYAYIVQKLGVTPEHILSVTFTNKAAREMRDRIRALMPDGDGGWILTFHGACHKILKEEIGFFAYPENFMVMDEEDQKSVLQRIFQRLQHTADVQKSIRNHQHMADVPPQQALGDFRYRMQYLRTAVRQNRQGQTQNRLKTAAVEPIKWMHVRLLSLTNQHFA